MTDNDNLKKEEIQSDDPIIQKCLNVIRNKEVTVEDLANIGYYSVYIDDKKYFTINKDFLIGLGTIYRMKINNQTYEFCGQRPDLEELHRLCVSKYNEQSQERKKNTLDFLNDADRSEKTKTDKRHLTPGQKMGVMFMSWGLLMIAIGVINYKISTKRERVKKQVEAYEKTLPGYLEQKQAVEHYRDSLMTVKGR